MSLPLLESDLDEIVAGLRNDTEVLAGKTFVITGARGFIGRYLVQALMRLNLALDRPVRVLAYDNLITAKEDSGSDDEPEVKFIQHDVVQPFKVDEPVDFIIHAAGIASPYFYRAFPLQTLDVATTGTKNLLELAHKHGSRLLFMSSSEIYGDPHPDHVPTPESYRGNVATLGPRACYDEGKRVGETFCYVFHEMYGVASIVVRPFNVFGPGMSEKDYRVLPNLAASLKVGRPFKIYGTGSQTRTYCYVTDAIVGFFKALLHGVPGEPYNIGNPIPEISVEDLARRVEKVLNRSIDYIVTEYPDSYPADEPARRCPDIRKAQLQLNFDPVVPLEEGLRRFFTWTDEHYSASS